MKNIHLLLGDCMTRMAEMEQHSVNAVVCDPPYNLTVVSSKDLTTISQDKPQGRTAGFMGKTWDGEGLPFKVELWEAVFRILVPGGVVKAFGGTRTFHRMALAMTTVGFLDVHLEAWGYGSGFPKSHNISKAIDKAAGAERGTKKVPFTGNALMRAGGQNTRPWMEEALEKGHHELPDDTPVTEEAKLWDGWGTALKPAWEPILVGRKP